MIHEYSEQLDVQINSEVSILFQYTISNSTIPNVIFQGDTSYQFEASLPVAKIHFQKNVVKKLKQGSVVKKLKKTFKNYEINLKNIEF